MPNAIASGMAMVDETRPATMSPRNAVTLNIVARDAVESVSIELLTLAARSMASGGNGVQP
jgi:hypothetical protein